MYSLKDLKRNMTQILNSSGDTLAFLQLKCSNMPTFATLKKLSMNRYIPFTLYEVFVTSDLR